MACNILDGYRVGCRDNAGGVTTVYIAPYNDVTSFTTDSTGKITAITTGMSPSPAFKTFQQDNEVASYTEVSTNSTENGTVYYTKTVELTMLKMTQSLQNQTAVLNSGAWRIIVKDSNGSYFLLGTVSPIRTTTSASGTGKALGDQNGSKITFEVKEGVPSPEILASAALAVIG